jgi:Holliday junction resolvasome RuvABC endonuclease subunit
VPTFLYMPINLVPLFTTGKYNYLFIDPSASHMGWAIVTIDHDLKTSVTHHVGMCWTKGTWVRGQRYRYMYRSIESIIRCDAGNMKIDGIIIEGYFANPKMLHGSAVIPTIMAFAEMVASEYNVGYLEIGPPSWRSVLGIKPTKDSKGKRDYKGPTKAYVESLMGQLPENILSNIKLKERMMPTDVPDCLAIAIAYSKYVGVTDIKLAPDAFKPLTILSYLDILTSSI